MGAAAINYDGDMSGETDPDALPDVAGMGSRDLAGTTGGGAATSGTDVGPNTGGMALTAAGAFTSAFGTYLAAKYNRHTLERNAQLARMQAQQAIQAGQFAANRVTTRERTMEGQQRSSAAAGGVVANAGSNKAVQASSEAAGAMDRYMIELNARRQALGFNLRAVGDESQGRLEDLNAKQQIGSTVANAAAMEWLEADPTFAGYRRGGIQFAQ